MENAFGKVVSMLLLIGMLFIMPLKYYMEKNEAVKDMVITTKTIEFVDAVRNTGFISKDMYEQYLRGIHGLGGLYQIELEHRDFQIKDLSREEQIFMLSDIEGLIFNEGTYHFGIEDYFKVEIIKLPKKELVCYYGGFIKNEIY